MTRERVWYALIGTFLLAGLALAVPTMWLWGINSGRFLASPLKGLLVLVPALALLPAVARAASRWMDAIGTAIFHDARGTLGFTAATALFVGLNPDRLHFTGDFLLRENAASHLESYAKMLPQAFPLDIFLHSSLPYFLATHGVMSAELEGRWLGALEAGVLAWLALRLARTLASGSAERLAIATLLVGAGSLSLFTGMNKSFTELVLCAAAVGVFGVEVVATGRSMLLLGCAGALAASLHRTGLLLLPAAALPLIANLGAGDRARHARAREALILLCGATLLVSWGAWRIFLTYDLGANLPELAHRSRDFHFLALAITDRLNGLLLLLPTLPLLLIVGFDRRVRHPAADGLVLTLARIAPLLVLLIAVQPPQGFFRDWDMFAAPAALAMVQLLVWFAAAGGERELTTWSLALCLGAALPVAQFMLVQRDLPAALARVNAIVSEPPARDRNETGRTWAFLAMRYWQLKDFAAAARFADSAATVAPSKPVLEVLASSQEAIGNYGDARLTYGRMLKRDSTDWRNWIGLGTANLMLGDTVAARANLTRARTLHPVHSYADELLRGLSGPPP